MFHVSFSRENIYYFQNEILLLVVINNKIEKFSLYFSRDHFLGNLRIFHFPS